MAAGAGSRMFLVTAYVPSESLSARGTGQGMLRTGADASAAYDMICKFDVIHHISKQPLAPRPAQETCKPTA